MFDWGFDASLGYFVLPKSGGDLPSQLPRVTVRSRRPSKGRSAPTGIPFNTRQVWLSLEAIGIKNCPYTSALYIYSSGQTGLLVPAQFLVRF